MQTLRRVARVLLSAGLALVAAVSAMGQDGGSPLDAGIAPVVSDALAAGRHPGLRASCQTDFAAAVWQLYGDRGQRWLWVVDGVPTAQATAVLATLARAGEHGLSGGDYGLAALESWRPKLSGAAAAIDEVARFDVALSLATACFAGDLYRGRIRPSAVGFALREGRDELDIAGLVAGLAQSADAAAALLALAPQSAMYKGLVDGLARYRELSGRVDSLAVAPLPTLRPGDSDAGVTRLRAYLGALGDGSSERVEQPELYDASLVAAVQRFQRRHGLDADGVVGTRTLAALLVPMRTRVRQIELALERMRWLPDLNRRLLLVNIPEFRLRVFGPGAATPVLEMKLVVGSAVNKTRTALFSATLEYVVFRPYWHVPYSIASREMLPRLGRDPDYLRRKRIEVVGREGLSAAALASGGARLRQKPGPGNSLGLIKFIFPNRYNIYMHDTPEKQLFARDRRDFSHGCIRLEDAPALATTLLADQGWDAERVLAATQGHDSFRVNLDSPVPVVVSYMTAVAGDDGAIHFFEDIYDRDPELSRMLVAR